MTIRFEKAVAVGKPAEFGPQFSPYTGGTIRFWEALPLALYKCVNAGMSGSANGYVALTIFETERVMRIILFFVGGFTAGYAVFMNDVFTLSIDVANDWFAVVALASFYTGLGVLFLAQTWGRFTSLKIDSEARLTDPKLSLQSLLLNYEPFGLGQPVGWLAAFLVVGTQLIYVVAWVFTLYICATRMLARVAREDLFMAIWIAAFVQNFLSVFARSVSFDRLISDYGSGVGAAERTRVALTCFYIFVSVVFVWPSFLAFVVYVRF